MPPPITRHIPSEVIAEADTVDTAYDRTGIEELVRQYAYHKGDYGLEGNIDKALADLANDLARIATQSGEINVELIRQGFDRLYSDMNRHAATARGLRKPAGPIGWVLEKSGIREPQYRQVLIPLDDRYWNRQFLAQFHDSVLTERREGESDQDYLARYTLHCLKGFPWAYFTYCV